MINYLSKKYTIIFIVIKVNMDRNKQKQKQGIVLDIKDALVDNITLGKQQAYHINYHLIPMYYMLDKDTKDTQALVIKTPRIFIPHSLYARGGNQTNQYLEIVFLNEGGDPMLAALKKWIKRVEARVIKILSRRKTIKLDDKEFTSLLKEDDNYKSSKIYLTIQSDKNECIDTDNKPIPSWEFVAPCYGFFVLQFKNIWMNASKWGINLYTQGAMVLPSQIGNPPQVKIQHLFDDELLAYRPIGDDECYQRFYKMLKMGVPLQAVQHKMLSEAPHLIQSVMKYSSDTLIINIPELNNNNNEVSSIPPAPPAPPSFSSFQKNPMNPDDIRKQILGAITGGVQLRKTSESQQHSNSQGIEKKKIMGNIRRDLMVPTLDEIRNALQNLKKKETL
jgi:hypothetical protein